MIDKENSVGLVKTEIVKVDLPSEGFKLESGEFLQELHIAYESYGKLNDAEDNVIFICHALTGDAHVAGYHSEDDKASGWWDEMVGPCKAVNTDLYYVICANILGGCKGTTGPSSINPGSGKPYGSVFPEITVGDIVNVHIELLKHLGIKRVAAIIGGSFGGMQVLEWAIRYPEMVDRCICVASATSLSTQALAFDIVGRKAIIEDKNWNNGNYYGTGVFPAKGLAQARMIGHITYLSREMMSRKFGRERKELSNPDPNGFHSDFQVESYLDYQGDKFVSRFDANSYLHITRAMDEYDLYERFGGSERAFAHLSAKLMVVALSEDWLFLPEQSENLANALLGAGKPVSYCRLHAPYGHDAFLVDIKHLGCVIRAFLPWVGMDKAPVSSRISSVARNEHQIIAEMIGEGASVVDLGCGDGSLLGLLKEKRGIKGFGVDKDLNNVISVIDRGFDVFQADIDEGLSMIPDKSFDYAVLSETLQEVQKPKEVLLEILRVAREGIVSFPNFGKFSHRLQLLFTGKMPKGGALPFEWYDTPNIHLFTYRDFVDLCRNNGIKILETICVRHGKANRLMGCLGVSVMADKVLVRIARA